MFPPMSNSSPERGYSQYEVVPSSQSQERDYAWPTGGTSSRSRTSSDELVPTSQYDEVELHIPESSRTDDNLWLIGMSRAGENTSEKSQRERLVTSPIPVKNRRNPNDGGTSLNTQLCIDEAGSASSVESPSGLHSSPKYVKQISWSLQAAYRHTTASMKETKAPANRT